MAESNAFSLKAILGYLPNLGIAILLGQTLFFKFSGAEESVYIFQTLGVEPWGRLMIASLELVAVALILFPRTSAFGAALAAGLMVGALASHALFLGIVVKDDDGLLFYIALIILALSLWVLVKERSTIFLLLERFIPKSSGLSLLLVVGLIGLNACTVKPDIDPLPPRIDKVSVLRFSPRTISIVQGAEVSVMATFQDREGNVSNVAMESLELDALNSNTAKVSGASKIMGLQVGSALFVGRFSGLVDTLQVNVIADSTQLATIEIEADSTDLLVNNKSAIRVSGKDLKGNPVAISNVVFSVAPSANASIANNVVTASRAGEFRLTAKVGEVVSRELTFSVRLMGTFIGTDGHFGRGDVIVRQVNGQLTIFMQPNFVCQQVPDPIVTLSNSLTGKEVLLGGLTRFTGAQEYKAPANIQLSDYKYVNVWCRRFNQGVLSAEVNK